MKFQQYKMKKSQISMEFIMIISLVFLVFIGFLALMYNQFSELNEEKDYSSLYNLANLIKNEVLIASKVHDNYIRKFEIPYTINGKDYKIDLEKDVLVITNENNLSVTVILPVETKGGFIEKTKKGQMEHCITKNKHDGVRISRNQATVEPVDLKDNDGDGILEVGSGKIFYVFVRMNCLDNVHTVGFTLELPQNIHFEDYDLLYQYDGVGIPTDHITPFFEKEPTILEPTISGNLITFIILQKIGGEATSGSGNVVKIVLKALSGEAEIKFYEDSVYFMDVITTETKQRLPYSDIPMKIEII